MEENRNGERDDHNTQEVNRRARRNTGLKGFDVNFEQQRGSYKNSDLGGNGRPQERSNDDRNNDENEQKQKTGSRR